MWIKERPIQMRFIELMQTGEMASIFFINTIYQVKF